MKAGFRWIIIKRLPSTAADNAAASLFTMTFGVKEKKQKSQTILTVVCFFFSSGIGLIVVCFVCLVVFLFVFCGFSLRPGQKEGEGERNGQRHQPARLSGQDPPLAAQRSVSCTGTYLPSFADF